MRRVVIVGFPPVQILDVSGPLEVFSIAPGYTVQLGNPGTDSNLQTNRGIALAGAVPICEIAGTIDTLVIAGGPGSETGRYDESFVAWIADASARSRRVASICTGAFLLGAAGLIDHKKVVTHWKFCDELARKFPLASVQPDPIYLKDGTIYTSAGITRESIFRSHLLKKIWDTKRHCKSPATSSCSWCVRADKRNTVICFPVRP
jgi:transcriptional regulator GlxA family with amidase domain